MATDHIRYDILAQQALRGLVRQVLADAAKKGLPGEHHFFITFDTRSDGVRLSARMRAQYPEEMTIVLQHQFWDLKVTDETLEVGLSFGGVAEKLAVPLEAVTEFRDPSVQFALQFQAVPESEEGAAPAAPAKTRPEAKTDAAKAKPRSSARPEPRASVPAAPMAKSPASVSVPDDKPPEPPADRPSGEVVRLDRFRKK